MLFLFFTCFTTYCGDADTDSLRAEIRTLRNAYESRISELEAEVKDLRTGTAKTTDKAVADALAKKTPADKALSDQPLNLHQTAPTARAASRIVIGGYSEFRYIDRGNRIPEFNQARTVLELAASLNE